MPFISASAISLYNSIRGGGAAASTLLLDLYPDSAAAYSLRKLSTAYTDSSIKVRRSSDNTEQDIGFVGNELDTTSLLSFVGSGDGFVTTWYDQSGAGNDATQINASNQPQIVSSGSVIKQNGKPNLQFDGSNDYFEASTVTTGNPKSIFIPTKFDSIGSTEKVIFDSITTNQSLLYKSISNRIGIGFGSFILTSYTATTDFILYSIFHNGSTSNVYIDSSTQIVNNQNLGTNAFNGLRIGAVRGSASLFFNGFIPEFIMWGSEQSSNKAGIETNINSYYNMYWDGSQTGLLDDYPNAAAAYSLRALNSEYTGAAIKARKTVEGETFVQDIGFLYDGSLDTASLLSFAGSDDVFVQIWYDQSGEGIDIENITASKQPKLVNNGILETKGGFPVAKFSGGQVLNATIQGDFLGVSGRTSFAAAYGDTVDSTFVRFSDNFDGLGAGADGISFAVGTGTDDVGVRNYQASPSINGSQTLPYALSDVVLMSHITTGSTGLTYIDSQAATGNAGLRGGSWYWGVGARSTTLTGALNGGIFEAIHFASDQSASRAAIETNINEHYNVY
jgi:hypothetical protein